MKERYSIPSLISIPHNKKLNEILLNEDDFKKYFFQFETNIKGSLFICTLARCDSIESARNAIDFIQKKYADATHNCWAFQVDKPKSSANIGYSDDGEPHGTAGKPMLTSLLYADIGEVVAIVTRYFGGTKLGTGGLVRAYQGSVLSALEVLPLTQKVEKITLEIILDYSHSGFLHRMLENYEIEIQAENFQADIIYTLTLPEDRKEEFLAELQRVTDGTFICL